MPRIVKREVVQMPLFTNAYGARRNDKGEPSGPMFECVIETVEASPAQAARSRMLAAQRAAGIAC